VRGRDMALPSLAQARSRPFAGEATSRPPEMRAGIYRRHPITYAIIDGKPSSEGDIVLDHVTELASGQPSAKRPTPEAAGIAYP
jgi:hypothetical protein